MQAIKCHHWQGCLQQIILELMSHADAQSAANLVQLKFPHLYVCFAGAFFGSMVPRLQPRFYSISSSPKQYPDSIHVTCAVVIDTTATGRKHEGVCSNYLKRLSVGVTPNPDDVLHLSNAMTLQCYLHRARCCQWCFPHFCNMCVSWVFRGCAHLCALCQGREYLSL